MYPEDILNAAYFFQEWYLKQRDKKAVDWEED